MQTPNAPGPNIDRIFRQMEDAQDYTLLEEMNGTKCAGRQFSFFARDQRATQTQVDRIALAQRRPSAQRANKMVHRGFEKAGFRD